MSSGCHVRSRGFIRAIVLLCLPLWIPAGTTAQERVSGDALRGVISMAARDELAAFHANRAKRLSNLKLDDVLKRKNPYLFRAKNLATATEFVDTILDAHVSSQEEGIFGGVLERIAVAVNAAAFGGRKSGIEGIDLEFESGTTRYLVSIKSGPNWGNSSQIHRMRADFKKARRTLGTNTKCESGRVVAVNGCCYGTTATEDKGDYLKLCGARFWELISGDTDCYQWIMQALETSQTEAEDKFNRALALKRAELADEFAKRFCDADGAIRWDALLKMNSLRGG